MEKELLVDLKELVNLKDRISDLTQFADKTKALLNDMENIYFTVDDSKYRECYFKNTLIHFNMLTDYNQQLYLGIYDLDAMISNLNGKEREENE